MTESYLPSELWRVAVQKSGRRYGDPASRTFARESVARDYAARCRGARVRLFRTLPTWEEVPVDGERGEG